LIQCAAQALEVLLEKFRELPEADSTSAGEDGRDCIPDQLSNSRGDAQASSASRDS
jgi:hypothetical protein